MKTYISLGLICCFLISGCTADRKFPEVKSLSEYKNTLFVPNLEHEVPDNKNTIYCATLLFAWDEIRKQLPDLIVSESYPDLYLLNQSKTFRQVLKENEYRVSSEIQGTMIRARAELNKSLPFETKLESYKGKLTFNGVKVASFGFTGDNDECSRITRVLYYKDDNNFILQLSPKDQEHTILFFKTEERFHSMIEMTHEISKRIEQGKTEITDSQNWWKYSINSDDIILIPKFMYNIETNYKTLEGSGFRAHNQSYQVQEAWQRTAFILDEVGAEIESEAEIKADGAAAPSDTKIEKPKPKKMILDKPFLVLLQRINAENPYFGMWTVDSELMVKE